MTSSTLIIPGFGGSGDAHWQTIWQHADPSIVRLRPTSWKQPELDDWIAALDRAIAELRDPPVVVAHSLGCLLLPHWVARGHGGRIRGAMLVAVPDPDGANFPPEAGSFRPVPDTPLPFPTLIVASSDDPFGSLAYARRQAARWQAGIVVGGALGHVNGQSGLGEWPLGAMLLQAFRTGTGDPYAAEGAYG